MIPSDPVAEAVRIADDDVRTNRAFDVTPTALVTGYITEEGIHDVP